MKRLPVVGEEKSLTQIRAGSPRKYDRRLAILKT
jgi:hypothetical protein